MKAAVLLNPTKPSVPVALAASRPRALASALDITKLAPPVGSAAGRWATAVASVAEVASFVKAVLIWL